MGELCFHTQGRERNILVCLVVGLNSVTVGDELRRGGAGNVQIFELGGREFKVSLSSVRFGSDPDGLSFCFYCITIHFQIIPPLFGSISFLFMFILYIYVCNNHQLSKLGSVVRRLACNPEVIGSTPSAPFVLFSPFFLFSSFLLILFIYLFITFIT